MAGLLYDHLIPSPRHPVTEGDGTEGITTIPQSNQTRKGQNTMTIEQITAVRCAYLDLRGAFEMIKKGQDLRDHDWDAVELTLGELESAFDIELKDLIETEVKVSA
jgi:hypothetical protein